MTGHSLAISPTGKSNKNYLYLYIQDTWVASNNIGRQNAINTDVPIRLDITAESWVSTLTSRSKPSST